MEDTNRGDWDVARTTADKSFIWVTFQKEGIHKYPDAPEGVEFLKYPHRHIFHFRVELEVWHDDREVEFILFKRELENLYSDAVDSSTQGTLNLDFKSCEMMARELYGYINDFYPGRAVQIEVSEDGENGCRLYWGEEDDD
jgi:hypothetical protein